MEPTLKQKTPKAPKPKAKVKDKSQYGEVGEHKMGLQKTFTMATADEIRAKAKPHQVHDLGNGLELWLVDLALLKEQSINARAMTPDAFNQLSQNIESRGALESMPLCAMTDAGIEIVSGHHRVRAARKAELDQIWVLVDVSGLNRDQIKSKQLAHNSLQGQDNADIVKQIFDSIQNVEARIEAFIDPDLDALKGAMSFSTKELEIEFAARVSVIMFLPAQYEVFKHAMNQLKMLEEVNDVFLATREEYDTMTSVLSDVSSHYDITSTPTLFAKMAEIVRDHINAEPIDGEHTED